MNILIPDNWLRDYLHTKATPAQLKECISLCGPSIERIYGSGKDTVYDIEVTGNRPDAMSVVGIAREAAAILPRFGVPAKLVGDPYTIKFKVPQISKKLPITIKTNPDLNPRWTSVVLENVTVKSSPSWLKKYLELSGLRSLNNVVDVTNFLMRAYGQPSHVFDYDRIEGHHMTLRASLPGEELVTLDGKPHKLPGGDIVIEDGSGSLIDLCGIMGGKNSSVTDKTTRVVFFIQTYDPVQIRKSSMALGQRTEASSLFEKGLDTELVYPVFLRGIELLKELTAGDIASQITDIYPKPYKKYAVSAKRSKIESYVGNITDKEIKKILLPLGFSPSTSKETVTLLVPSFRRDVKLDVDIIEEIARLFGYHNIPASLPSGVPPVVVPDNSLIWEHELKIRLRDWGFTELYTYSMISRDQMGAWSLDIKKAYKIANPLSDEWVYLRPKLWPSVLSAISHNLNHSPHQKVFELSMVYEFRLHDLPQERSALVVAWTGNHFREARGVAEVIFELFGIEFPKDEPNAAGHHSWNDQVRLILGSFGSVSQINQDFLENLGIYEPVTMISLYVDELVKHAKPIKKYTPIPLYPPLVEDLSFVVPHRFRVGPFIQAIQNADPLISHVSLLDIHKDSRTFHVVYQDKNKNLTTEEIAPIRKKLIGIAKDTFGLTLRTIALSQK